MASFKKTFVAATIFFTIVTVPMQTQAAIPALIAGWLLEITGGSILISDLVAGQAGIISAVMWWDCNKFKLAAPCTNKTPMPATQLPKPAITISLKPDSVRQNPDPAKFNDAAPGSGKRDVTPKTKIAAAGNPPPAAPAGPLGTGNYKQDPSSPISGPSANSTLQYMAQQSHANGDVTVAGVVIVRQSFAPDRAFPFVAKVVTCIGTDEQSLQNCTAVRNANNAALEQEYLTPARYSYSISVPNLPAGYIVTGKAVVFYDQARDITVTCDAGYAINANDPSQCDLVDTAAVKKPADTTCELLFDPVTKKMVTDKANPACDGLDDSTKVSLSSSDGSQAITVSANVGNGFDISITKADGSKTALDTGIYDPGTGGYVVVHTTVIPPLNPQNGMGCGGPGQGACNVEFALDSGTSNAVASTRAADTAADASLQGQMNGIDSGKFAWSFIPNIPTATCKNPMLKSPVGDAMIDMDICSGFSKFSFFLNAVLAVLCVYGCVRQIQAAVRA